MNKHLLVVCAVMTLTACTTASLHRTIGDTPTSNYLSPPMGTLSEVVAQKRGRAVLPCNMTSNTANDRITGVMFRRRRLPVSSTIYKVVSGNHWVSHGYLERASVWTGRGRDQGLTLDYLTLKDEGEYECEVHFLHASPTLTRIMLKVVERPEEVAIYIGPDKVESTTGGPFRLHEDVTLNCLARGGYPSPVLEWSESSHVLESVTVDKTHKTLRLGPVTRKDNHRNLTCRDTISGLSKTITLEVHSPAETIQIIGGDDSREGVTLSKGVEDSLVCQVTGAWPRPNITWTHNSTPFPENSTSLTSGMENGLLVINSTLKFIPPKEYENFSLMCSADNTWYNNSTSTRITIKYKPEVKVQHCDDSNLKEWKEGDDLCLHCSSNANPLPSTFAWFYNDQWEVDASGEYFKRNSIMRSASGNYSCIATNAEGTGSDTLSLIVPYAPTCKEYQQEYKVNARDALTLHCPVDAYPPPNIFRWEKRALSGEMVVMDGETKEELKLRIPTQRYSSNIHCTAVNPVGEQKEPCVFNISSANVTDAAAEVTSGSTVESRSQSHKYITYTVVGFVVVVLVSLVLFLWRKRKRNLSTQQNGAASGEASRPVDEVTSLEHNGVPTHTLGVQNSVNISGTCLLNENPVPVLSMELSDRNGRHKTYQSSGVAYSTGEGVSENTGVESINLTSSETAT